jgi:predicted amidohydrolase
MKIASVQYSYKPLKNFKAYAKKITKLVENYAAQNIQIVLLPEYAGFEMVAFATLEEMQGLLPQYLELFQELSRRHNLFICSGTLMVTTPQGTFNRCYFFSPSGKVEYQDKCNLTPFETEEGILSPGNSLKLFKTTLGPIAICICYDVEFPTLVRQLTDAGAELILVPSYTSSVEGFYRVFLSCRARALENQCYVIQSCLVGHTDTEMTYGSAAACTPVDAGFPEDGLLALGKRDKAGDIVVEIELSRLKAVREKGQTKNYKDGQLLTRRSLKLELLDLS